MLCLGSRLPPGLYMSKSLIRNLVFLKLNVKNVFNLELFEYIYITIFFYKLKDLLWDDKLLRAALLLRWICGYSPQINWFAVHKYGGINTYNVDINIVLKNDSIYDFFYFFFVCHGYNLRLNYCKYSHLYFGTKSVLLFLLEDIGDLNIDFAKLGLFILHAPLYIFMVSKFFLNQELFVWFFTFFKFLLEYNE